MAERYYEQIGDSYCMNCGHPKEDHRQHRDGKPPHCPINKPVAERLPVIYAALYPSGALDCMSHKESIIRQHVSVVGGSVVEYIPRSQAAGELVRCRECVHFLNPNPIGEVECNSWKGLGTPRKDGSDYCPYAERKARG